MANPRIIPKKSVVSKVPLTTDLVSGEVAVNYADQQWYGKHPSTGAVVEIGAPYLHSHDQLLSLDKANELELTNSGTLVLSIGANATTFTPTSTTNRTLTLPDKNGTLATLDDVSGGGTTNNYLASKTLFIFTPRDSNPPSSAFATLDTRNSIAVLDYDDGATNEASFFVSVIPEGANLTSGLKISLHWMASTATTGVVRWGVQLERSDTDLDSDSFDTAIEANATTSATAGIPTVTEITTTSLDGLTAGDLFRLRVYRDSSDTTNDTMTGDAELIAVEVTSAA